MPKSGLKQWVGLNPVFSWRPLPQNFLGNFEAFNRLALKEEAEGILLA